MVIFTITIPQESFTQSSSIDSLIYVTKTELNDSLVNTAYRNIMLHYIRNTNTDSAIYWGDRLLDYSEDQNYPPAATTANYYKAYYHYLKGDYDKVIALSNNVVRLTQEQGKLNNTVDALSRIADTYNLLGKYDSSQLYILRAEYMADSIKDYHQLCKVLISKGNLAMAASKHNEAASSFLKVDSIQKTTEIPDHYRHGLARHNIALIYFQQLERPEDALRYAQLASTSYFLMGPRGVPSSNSLNILLSRIYLSQNQLERADSLVTSSIEYFKEHGHSKKLAEAYVIKSNIYVKSKNYDMAESSSKKALDIYSKINQKLEVSTTHAQLGRLFKEKGNYNQSIYHLNQSLTYNTNVDTKIKTTQILAETQGLKGDYKNAFNALLHHNRLKDSLYASALDDKFAELEIRYETADKERKIAALEIEKIKTQSKNSRKRLMGSILLLGLGGLALFLFQSNRQKKKINQTLKEVDNLKSKFFSNISHELRTPLSLIKGPVDVLIKSNTLDGSEKQQLLIVQRNAKRLTRLVNDLLELSRIESGTRQLRVQSLNAENHLKTLFSNFESAAISNGQEYIYRVNEISTITYYEPEIMETVVYNLISNALKYSPEGALIDIEATVENDNLNIIVSNNGHPIPTSELDKIFNRFYRMERYAKNIEGVGVGLALVKELVHTHKGKIEVISSVEEGTSFIVSIPIGENAYSSKEIISSSFVPSKSATIPLMTELMDSTYNADAPVMLIVEDNLDMRSFLTSSFSKEYQVRVAKNGKEGLEIAKEISPDIIISDMMMPIMDGAEMCKAIKNDLAINHIPVIVLTAKAEEQTKLSTLDIGVDDYIAKPFSIDEITIKARNLLNVRTELQKRFANSSFKEKKELAISPVDQDFWNRIEAVLEDQLSNEEYTIESFAIEMSMSRMQLHRKLKALTGLSASTFIRNERLNKAKQLMDSQKLRVSEVAYECGFSSPFYFSKCFKDQFGMSPKEYQQVIRK